MRIERKPIFKVVLVHLGESHADHLWINLESLLKRFTEVHFVLISDKPHPRIPSNSRLEFFQYHRLANFEASLDNLSHDQKFRSGFWKYTLERFFALSQYHDLNPEVKVLHIESDILLLPDFPFNSLASLTKLSWQRVDDERDAASILFTPNNVETTWFVDQFIRLIERQNRITDMSGLRQIRMANNSRIQVLPSFSLSLGSQISWKNVNDTELARELSVDFEILGGIFDPAAFGMWLTGSDPRNYHGKQILFDTKTIVRDGTFINPSKFFYNLSPSRELFISTRFGKARIWSLHVHSKDLRLFGENWESRLRHLVNLSGQSEVFAEFHLKTFLRLIASTWREGTFLSWILHFPRIKPFFLSILHLRSMLRGKFRKSK